MLDWRPISRAYLDHHMHCPLCIAASKGESYGQRCPIGAPLWLAYQKTTPPSAPPRPKPTWTR